jgi:hypothetical protein
MADGVLRLTSVTSFTTERQGHDGIDQALNQSAELSTCPFLELY